MTTAFATESVFPYVTRILVAVITAIGLVIVEMLRRNNKATKKTVFNTQPNGGASPYDQLVQKNDQLMRERNSEVLDRLDLIDRRTERIDGRQDRLETKFERLIQQLEKNQ